MFHQVHPEAVDLVDFGPGDHAVHHQLLEHAVFGGGVLATGGGFYGTGLDIQTVVVTRDCLVQH